MSRNGTILLYLMIYISSVFLLGLSQRRNKGKWNFNVIPFFISFIILWVISCFTRIGADYDNYYRIIEKSAYIIEENGIVECVFNATCSFLYTIFRNADKVIFILKTLTLFLYFRAIYMIKDRALLWMSILAFTLLSFLEFYLISMHLAIALFTFSIVYLIEGDDKKSIIFYVIACLTHSTSFLFLPVMVIFYVFKCNKRVLTPMQIFFISSTSLLLYALLTFIYEYAISEIQFFMHYSNYEIEAESKGTGLFLYVTYIPIILFAISIYKSLCFSHRFKNVFILYSVFFFLFGLVAYKIQVFGRMSNYAIVNYMIILPMYFCERKYSRQFRGWMPKNVVMFIWTIFLILQGLITFMGKINSDTSQLDSWEYFMPFLMI